MFLATRNLIGSCCRGGSNVMAVSASIASVLIQFFGLEWILNFRPFCRSSSSSFGKLYIGFVYYAWEERVISVGIFFSSIGEVLEFFS